MTACITCNADIPASWVAALNSGICPGCGGPIYSEEHQNLLEELKAAIQEMEKADIESIVGWLLSNYRMTKIGDAKPTEFHRAKQNQPNAAGPDDPMPNLKQADNLLAENLKRAGMTQKSVDKMSQIRELVNHINKKAGGENEDVEMYPIEETAEYEDYEQPVSKSASSIARAMENNSMTVPASEPGIKPLQPNELAGLQKESNYEKIDGIPKVLVDARMEKLRKQKAALDGNGIIRRGY